MQPETVEPSVMVTWALPSMGPGTPPAQGACAWADGLRRCALSQARHMHARWLRRIKSWRVCAESAVLIKIHVLMSRFMYIVSDLLLLCLF